MDHAGIQPAALYPCIQASTIAKGILVWTSFFDGTSKLLSDRACDDVPEEVANNPPTGTPDRVFQLQSTSETVAFWIQFFSPTHFFPSAAKVVCQDRQSRW